MGDGPEPIADKNERECLRRSARTMGLAIVASAFAATGLFLIPA